MITLWGICYYTHFTDKETGTKRLDNFKVTEFVVHGGVKTWTQVSYAKTSTSLHDIDENLRNYLFYSLHLLSPSILAKCMTRLRSCNIEANSVFKWGRD